MSNTDVRVLFPDREKKKRTKRGQRPTRWLLAPSYDELIKVAFNPTISDVQKYGRSTITFYLLQKEKDNKNLFGYMKTSEDSLYPNTIDSYTTLQAVYNDILKTPDWHDNIEDLIQVRSTKPSARIKNVDFMTKVRTLFNLSEVPVVVDDSIAPSKFSFLDNPPMEYVPFVAAPVPAPARPRPARAPRAPRPMIEQVEPIVEEAPNHINPLFQNAVAAVDGREIINQADIDRARQAFFDAEQAVRLNEPPDLNNYYWLDDEIQF
jgi:hypothetical protein